MNQAFLRFVLLLLVGAALAPLSGYLAGIAFAKEILIWIMATFFGALVHGTKGFLLMLALPGVLGAGWAWPLTCVIFPIAGLFIRGNPQATWLFALLGAIAGPVVSYGWIASGLKPLHSDLAGYMAGGAIGGFLAGALFGFALRRIDAALARAVAESHST